VSPAYLWQPPSSRTAFTARTGRAVVLDAHLGLVRPVLPRTPQGCEECLRDESPWLHLRLCLSCGHVGCCDSSPRRHARAHAFDVGHPIVRSFEPGESWRWCYVDENYV
jgi:hypothetical protein